MTSWLQVLEVSDSKTSTNTSTVKNIFFRRKSSSVHYMSRPMQYTHAIYMYNIVIFMCVKITKL